VCVDDAAERGVAVAYTTNVRRFLLLLFLLSLSLSACSHSSERAHGTSTTTTLRVIPSHAPTPSVTSHLEVASQTIKAGSAVRVVIVIENNTGTHIRQPACHTSTEWQAYLTNGRDASGPLPRPLVEPLCDPTKHESVPIGESRLAYTTHATYDHCADALDSYPPKPRCLPPPDIMPPLPLGRYTITVDKSPFVVVPEPAPLTAVIVS